MSTIASSVFSIPHTTDAVQAWRRAQYDATGVPSDPTHWLTQLLYELEGDAWSTGIESDKRNRGSAINIASTDRDDDLHLAIIQVREATFRPGRYTRVRKDYYLVGRGDQGEAFAHPLTDLVKSRSTVRQALARLWQCRPQDLDDIIRQGDVALVPTRTMREDLEPVGDEIILADSHIVRGEIMRDAAGNLYAASRVSIRHGKSEHPSIYTRKGLWRLQVALRGRPWGHTRPMGD